MIFATLVCTLVAVVLALILVRLGRRQEQEQRKMAQYLRREVNDTAAWKEYQ